jgi:hypothetical protein
MVGEGLLLAKKNARVVLPLQVFFSENLKV